MPLPRRTFLRHTVLAAPALIGLRASVRAQAAREGKLGVALCGLGGFSKQSIAPELPSAKNVFFAGAITGDAAKGRAWAQQYGFPEKNIWSYDTMARIADTKDIAIVHVVTPNSLHATHTIAAAKAGKHVMVEKPMATNSAQCEQMIAAAKSAGVRLGVSYRLHWEPHHVQAAGQLAGGAVGNVANGSYEFSWGYAGALADPERRKTIKQWLLDPKLTGGGALFDTGVYPIQAACMMTGRVPVAARGFASTRHKEIFPAGVEETMSFELTFADGFQALCRASYSGNFHQCTTYGPKGVVEILPGLPAGSVFGQSSNGKPNPKRLVVNRKEIATEDTLQLGAMLDAFAQAITTGAPFKADGAMGLRDVRIMEAVYASVAQGGKSVSIRT
ncbi:MAG: Gfo/Idh/MocA family oxidoreductase [Opitutaceae bacterium]|nr:Gfo/Idh/MocA family oxidoreductase [Opitutaceae bacterium]